MKLFDDLVDQYNLRARVFPAFLVALPLALGFVSIVPVHYQGLTGIVVSCVSLIGIWLFADHVKDVGEKSQVQLFQKWGGKPSVTLLRHSQKIISPQTLTRCHQKLMEIDPMLRIPSAEEDLSEESSQSLDVFASCNELLLEHARDKAKYGLLFEELTRYGTRRNLFAVRSMGWATASLGTVLCGAAAIVKFAKLDDINELSIVGCVSSGILLAFWLIVVNEQWVWRQATEYAKRLVLSAQTIEVKEAKQTKASLEGVSQTHST